jgi:hypothetical protein
MCLARIAESALACVMSGSLALGTETVRTRARVPALSCRDTYRAACVLVVIRLARIAENALARHGYVRLHGTWDKCGLDTRSCCESVQTRRIPFNTLGIPCIPSHVRQSHSKRRPCFDLNFPFLMLSLLQRPLQTPLMICQRSFETPLMVSGLFEPPLLDSELERTDGARAAMDASSDGREQRWTDDRQSSGSLCFVLMR